MKMAKFMNEGQCIYHVTGDVSRLKKLGDPKFVIFGSVISGVHCIYNHYFSGVKQQN